jgi:hypothetical protein
MGLQDQFATDVSLEQKGIIIDYGNDRIRIARAGGGNKKFARLLESKTKPFRRAIAVGAFDNDRSMDILRQVYAEAVVLSWEVNKGTMAEPKWETGIDPKDAGTKGEKLLPVTPVNVMKVFVNLPDLFSDLQLQAQAGALFRTELTEASAGN